MSSLILGFLLALGTWAEEDIFRKKPVTREEAVKLSAIFPGIGQISSGHRLKGTVFFVLEVASITGTFHAHETYRTKLSKFEQAKEEYLSSRSYSEAEERWRKLSRQKEELDRLRRTRYALACSCLGVYFLSLLDAAFISSYEVSLEPVRIKDALGITLEVRW